MRRGEKKWTPELLLQVRAHLRRRHLLMPGILAAHAFILLMLLLAPSNPIAAPAAASRLSVFDVAAADTLPPRQAQPEPPRVPSPQPMIELPVETPIDTSPPVFSAAAAQQAGFGTSCDLAALLGRAFENDPGLRAQLARIGPEARSVANAMMFWDGGWVPVEGRAPEDAVALLRQAVVEGVKAAPPECLSQEVAGPRFIPVKEAGRTMILVVGSATWRWQQLLESDPQAAPVTQLAQQSQQQPQQQPQQQ